ncbi:MAG: hypothetical protein WC378_08980 [Opitutaceae bacterium]
MTGPQRRHDTHSLHQHQSHSRRRQLGMSESLEKEGAIQARKFD